MAQSIVGNLRAVLGIDTGQFQTGLKQASGSLSGFASKIGVGLAAATAAAAAASAAVAFAVKGTLDAADELGKTAQKVGVGVESLSRLKYAAELSDISLEALGGGLKKLGVNLAGVAAGGAKPAAQALETLGISATDSNGQLKASDDVLREVAARFGTMRDGAQKTALAVALFGKSGSDLIPLLNAGAAGLSEMEAEAVRLGVAIDTKTAKAAEAFNDNLTRLKAVGGGLTTQLTAALAPALASISSALVAAAGSGAAMRVVGQTLGVVLRGLASVAIYVSTAFAGMGNAVGGAVEIIKRVVAGDFKGALEVAARTAARQVEIIKGGAASIATVWKEAGATTAAAAPAVARDLAAPAEQGAARTKKAVKDIETEAEKAVKAALELVKAEAQTSDDRGRTREQIEARKLLAAGSTLVAAGFGFEAMQAARLADEYVNLEKVEAAVVDLSPSLTKTPADLAEGIDDLADKRSTLDQIADAFYGVGDALAAAVGALKGGDFVSAISAAGAALGQIKAAFATGASFATKAGAVGAVGSVAGGLIGGKAGGAISGAASGFAAGAAFGPVGAAVGAVIGGIAGLVGASKAKKRAKKEAAERARLEAERKAAEEAATARELELRLLELTGKGVEAQAEREKDLLAALSPANAALQKQVLEAEKAATAAERLAEIGRARRALEVELLEATGQSAEALARLRADELEALPPELRELQRTIHDVADRTAAAAEAQAAYEAALADAEAARDQAREDLSEAYNREADAIAAVRDRMAELADTLADFGRELDAGGLSDLNPGQALAQARAAFDAVAGRTDPESLAALPAAGKALIEAARAAAPNAATVNRTIAQVRDAVRAGEVAARGQVTAAEAQLDALRAQVEGLITLNASVLSVRDAIAGLGAAMAAVATVANSNLEAAKAQAFDPLKMAEVAASAAVEALRVAPTPAQPGAAIAAEIVAALEPYNLAIIANTAAAARSLDDATGGGDSFRTVAA